MPNRVASCCWSVNTPRNRPIWTRNWCELTGTIVQFVSRSLIALWLVPCLRQASAFRFGTDWLINAGSSPPVPVLAACELRMPRQGLTLNATLFAGASGASDRLLQLSVRMFAQAQRSDSLNSGILRDSIVPKGHLGHFCAPPSLILARACSIDADCSMRVRFVQCRRVTDAAARFDAGRTQRVPHSGVHSLLCWHRLCRVARADCSACAMLCLHR
jgi:hypothetical protein